MTTANSEHLNPYAAPQLEGGYAPTWETGLDGLWRDGEVLVMHKESPLPPICVKSGQPATDWLQRDLIWHPRWITWTIFAAFPVYIVLALLLTRKASIMVGLSRQWVIRRRIRMLVTAGIIAGGMALAVGGFLLADHGMGYEIAILLVPTGVLGGLIGGTAYGQYACRLVWPQRMSNQFIWLKGVHPDFLKLLPAWTGENV